MQCDIQNTGVQFNSSNNNKKTQIKKGDHISVLNFSQPCSEAVFSPVHKINVRFIFSTTLNLNLVSCSTQSTLCDSFVMETFVHLNHILPLM